MNRLSDKQELIKTVCYFIIGMFFSLVVAKAVINNPDKLRKTIIGSQDSYELLKEQNYRAVFIKQVSEAAQKDTTVLPSIVIAQAILESQYGQSELSQKYNNLFGVKSNSKNGALYETKEHVTDPETGQIKEIVINDYFAKYNSFEESIREHNLLIKNGTTHNPNQYEKVLKAKNYEDAAYALQEAGYATDTHYPQKLISLIRQYGLYKYDPKN